jgi:hypothetical protein
MNQGSSVDLGNPKKSDLLSAVSDGKPYSLAVAVATDPPLHRAPRVYGIHLVIV